MLPSTTAAPLLPNFFSIWPRTFASMTSGLAPCETRST